MSHLPKDMLDWYVSEEIGFKVCPYDTITKKRMDTAGGDVKPKPVDKVRAMFEANSKLNIGMVPDKDFVVVDFDVKRKKADGEKRPIEQDPSFLHLPETVSATTPSGGRHFFYRCPKDLEVRTMIDLFKKHPVFGEKGKETDIRRKVDLLARGHAGVLLAPSSFGEGEYQWDEGHHPGQIEFAEFPLRVLLFPKIHIAEEKDMYWPRILEIGNLQDGDFRNGVLVSYASSLYATLRDMGNSVVKATAFVKDEVLKANREFADPLPERQVNGILKRFDKYTNKRNELKTFDQFHREEEIEQGSPAAVVSENGDLDWASILVKGTTNTFKYWLSLSVGGKMIELECSDVQIMDAVYIHRRISHTLGDFDLWCPYLDEKKKKYWPKDVLNEWSKKIERIPPILSNGRVLEAMRKYTETACDGKLMGAFSQAEKAVTTEEGVFFPSFGLFSFIRRSLGPRADENIIAITLAMCGAKLEIRGTHKHPFYFVTKENLYGGAQEGTISSETGIWENNDTGEGSTGEAEAWQERHDYELLSQKPDSHESEIGEAGGFGS